MREICKCDAKPVTLLKASLLQVFFSRFLNRTNGTKSHKASQISKFSTFSVRTPVIKRVSDHFLEKLQSIADEPNFFPVSLETGFQAYQRVNACACMGMI